MPSDAELLLEQAAAWQAQGHGVALATVVKTWGSSPRPPGSQLVVTDGVPGGAFAGSVSGGCIEGAVVTAALEAIAARAPRLLHFGVTHDLAWEVGLACGGQVEVFVQPLAGPNDKPNGCLSFDTFIKLRESVKSRRPACLVTSILTGETRFLTESDAASDPHAQDVTAALRSDRTADLEPATPGGDRLFIQPFCPPVRVLIVGAVHIAQPLSQLCALTGFEVTVIDPRTAFATAQRFPGVTRLTTWPADALKELGLDRRAAVITLTHDPKLDDPALEAALKSDAFYIGSLGSGKTHQSRLSRLRGRGFGDDALARIHGPVGLKLGGRAPAEIAVSILAQLIAELHRDPATAPASLAPGPGAP